MNKTQEKIQQLKDEGRTKWWIKNRCDVSWRTVHMWERGVFEPEGENKEKLEAL